MMFIATISQATKNFKLEPPPQFRPDVSNKLQKQTNLHQKTFHVPAPPPPLTTRISVKPSTTDVNIERGKSFQEARSAVQKQIEKMFVDSKDKDEGESRNQGIKHVSHGVSHVTPDEEDIYNPPPPMHYGVNQALKSLSSSPAQPPTSSSVSSMSQFSRDSVTHVLTRDKSSSQHHQTPIERNAKVLTFNTSALSSSPDRVSRVSNLNNNNNSSINSINSSSNNNIGNIDFSKRVGGNKSPNDRTKRSSMHEDMIMKSVGVALRDRGNKEDSVSRRKSVHQDKFDIVKPKIPPALPPPNPPKSLPVSPAPSSSSAIMSPSETEYEPISVQSQMSTSAISSSSNGGNR